MRSRAASLCPLAAFVSVALFVTACGSGNSAVEPPTTWVQTRADEFEGPEGTSPNPAMWTYDVGGSGWGNGQLEYDTSRPSNVALDGQGHLRIVARKERYLGRDYTSARIKTQGLVEQRYGRFEARIKLPKGQGLWPAFWMLGSDFDTIGWPYCGEIDIMEYRGQQPQVIHGTVHGPDYSGANPIGKSFQLTDGTTFADDFHVFAVDWDPGQIRFWVDSNVYQILTTAEVTAKGEWVFDHSFFVLLNLAVGGGFVGQVGSDTQFPAEMLVDYVRIFERSR